MSKSTVKVVEIDTNPAVKSIKDLRKELIEYKNQMANLEEGSDAFLEVANKAGTLKHQIDEINESVKGASADFGDMVGNVTNVAAGITGAFQAVAGGLQAIGVESEALDKTIAKMQGLMAVTQGLSAIDDGIKSLDKLRNSITATTGAAKLFKTVLQPKVLLAITAVITALVAIWNKWGDSIKEALPFLGKTTKQLEEEKKAAEEAEAAKKKQAEEEKNYATKVGNAIKDILANYKLLQGQYKRLQTEYQKKQWIEKNKDEFNKLGLSVKNLKDAEDTFVGNTDRVVQALIKRAIATAKQQQLTELAARYMEAQVLAENEYERKKVSAGSVVLGNSHTTEGGFEQIDRNGRWVFTQKGAERFNKQLKERLMSEANSLQTQMDKLATEIANEISIDEVIGNATKNGGSGGNEKLNNAISAIDIKLEELKRTHNIGSEEFKKSSEKQKAYLEEVKAEEEKRLKLLKQGTVEYAKQQTLIHNLDIEIKELGNTTTESTSSTTETIDEELENLKRLAEQWKDLLKTPKDIYDEEVAILDELKDQKLITDEEYVAAKKLLMQDLADWEKQLDDEVLAQKREKILLTTQVVSAGFNAIGSIMSELANNESAETKSSFEKQKKLQIAAATMSMLTGVINAWTSAMALPSPWNVIQGAIDTAATVALGSIQINKIKQQQFGGSGATANVNAGSVSSMIVPPVQYSQAVQGATTQGMITNQKVFVLESDIVNTIGKVQTQESENTY